MDRSSIQVEAPPHGVLSPARAQTAAPVARVGGRTLAYTIDCLIITTLLLFLPLPDFIGRPMSAMLNRLAAILVSDVSASLQGQPPTPLQYLRQFSHLASWAVVAFALAESVVEAVYFVFWEMLTGGRSPGKAMIGLRVVDRCGSRVGLRNSAIRNMMRVVDMLPASYAVGFAAMMLSDRRQRLGDRAAGTIVIRS